MVQPSASSESSTLCTHQSSVAPVRPSNFPLPGVAPLSSQEMAAITAVFQSTMKKELEITAYYNSNCCWQRLCFALAQFKNGLRPDLTVRMDVGSWAERGPLLSLLKQYPEKELWERVRWEKASFDDLVFGLYCDRLERKHIRPSMNSTVNSSYSTLSLDVYETALFYLGLSNSTKVETVSIPLTLGALQMGVEVMSESNQFRLTPLSSEANLSITSESFQFISELATEKLQRIEVPRQGCLNFIRYHLLLELNKLTTEKVSSCYALVLSHDERSRDYYLSEAKVSASTGAGSQLILDVSEANRHTIEMANSLVAEIASLKLPKVQVSTSCSTWGAWCSSWWVGKGRKPKVFHFYGSGSSSLYTPLKLLREHRASHTRCVSLEASAF